MYKKSSIIINPELHVIPSSLLTTYLSILLKITIATASFKTPSPNKIEFKTGN